MSLPRAEAFAESAEASMLLRFIFQEQIEQDIAELCISLPSEVINESGVRLGDVGEG